MISIVQAIFIGVLIFMIGTAFGIVFGSKDKYTVGIKKGEEDAK